MVLVALLAAKTGLVYFHLAGQRAFALSASCPDPLLEKPCTLPGNAQLLGKLNAADPLPGRGCDVEGQQPGF